MVKSFMLGFGATFFIYIQCLQCLQGEGDCGEKN